MASYHSEFITDLSLPPVQRPIPHQFAMGDSNAYTFTALVCDRRTPTMGLLDGDVTGSLVRPDGATVAFVGEKGEAVQEVTLPDDTVCNATPCSVTVPQACFSTPGRVTLMIRLTNGNEITQALNLSALVLRTATGTIVDPGEIIPDAGELYFIASEAQAAADNANAAAQHSVRYDEAQTLTSAQQVQARTNIDAASQTETAAAIADEASLREAADTTLNTAVNNRVRVDADQHLITSQQWQARTNIGAVSASEVQSAVAVETAARTAADNSLESAIATRVRFDQPQDLTDGQKKQARDNIEAASTDLVYDEVGTEAARRDQGDKDTLASAKSYADGLVHTEMTERMSADLTLQSDILKRVRFDEAQTLTDAQKALARTNIGATSQSDVGTAVSTAVSAEAAIRETADAGLSADIGNRVRYDAAQTLTSEQQAQARTNIGIVAAVSGTTLVLV